MSHPPEDPPQQDSGRPEPPMPADQPEGGPEPASGEEAQGRESLPFHKRCPVTVWFSMLLVVVYGLTSFPNGFERPTEWAVILGAFIPAAIQNGEIWRFVTATLLHGHPEHLFGNVIGLLIFGSLLEPLIGSGRLALLYVVSAAWGLMMSYFLVPHPTYGASTIDYGLIGCYLALVLLVRLRQDRALFWRELRGAIIFVLIFVAWDTLQSATVNGWGHLGGFMAGVLFAGWILEKRRKALER